MDFNHFETKAEEGRHRLQATMQFEIKNLSIPEDKLRDIGKDFCLFIKKTNETTATIIELSYNARSDVCDNDVKTCLNSLIFDEVAYFNDLEKARKTQITQNSCPVQFSASALAFKCYDCEADSTCVVCPECFFNANHENHKTRLIKASGGCCDCGDPQSWDTRGFCITHKDGPSVESFQESLKSLPEQLVLRFSTIARATVDYIINSTRPSAKGYQTQHVYASFYIKLCTNIRIGILV